jgi:hypothetical protein
MLGHFTKEKDDRRGEIVTALCSSGVLCCAPRFVRHRSSTS